jgi:hypothetical protein
MVNWGCRAAVKNSGPTQCKDRRRRRRGMELARGSVDCCPGRPADCLLAPARRLVGEELVRPGPPTNLYSPAHRPTETTTMCVRTGVRDWTHVLPRARPTCRHTPIPADAVVASRLAHHRLTGLQLQASKQAVPFPFSLYFKLGLRIMSSANKIIAVQLNIQTCAGYIRG